MTQFLVVDKVFPTVPCNPDTNPDLLWLHIENARGIPVLDPSTIPSRNLGCLFLDVMRHGNMRHGNMDAR